MNTTTRREKYRDETRKAILRAARSVFLRKGFAGISVRQLAEKVGCSHGNLYLHFKSKEQLFDCLVEESFDRLARALRGLKPPARINDPVALLKKAARAYVDFGLRNPGAYEFAFILRRPGRQRPLKPHLAYEYMQSLVGRCMEEKGLRPAGVEAASQAVWAAVHGVTSLFILRPTFPWTDRERLIQRVIEGAVDGLFAGRRAVLEM
jgi:AcrR family transcriptional regulator